MSTIQQAGRIVLYFLRFLARDGTTIYTLTRQYISAYVEYEQRGGLVLLDNFKVEKQNDS